MDFQTKPEETQVQPTQTTPSTPKVPKWETAARDRIKQNLPKIIKPISGLMERDAVEADTRMLITDLLCDVLGFDKYEDLTAEYQVKGDFADFGIRVDKQLRAFVEIKRVKQDLNKSHLRQVESYALREGVTWAILTNARVWELYRIEPVLGEQSDLNLVFRVDLFDETTPIRTKAELLYLISRESFQKKVLDDFWKGQEALSAKTIVKILQSKEVLEAVKKEIYRTHKQRVEIKQIQDSLNEVLNFKTK